MSNHDRAKQIEQYLWKCHNTTPSSKGIAEALDATEPSHGHKLDGTPIVKPRPAFIGDGVKLRGFPHERWTACGESVFGGIVIQGGDGKADGFAFDEITHLDGAPVSRIIEHRRPFPVSERLPTAAEANSRGKVLAFFSDGDMMAWDHALDHRMIIAWLPCPESGVE